LSLKKFAPWLVVIFLFGAFLQQTWLVTFSVAVAAVFLLAQVWKENALKGVNYSRRWHYRRGFPGETTTVRIVAENDKFLPLSWLRAADRWPDSVGPTLSQDAPDRAKRIANRGQLLNLYSFKWFEKITRAVEIQFRKRGVYPVGPVQLESGDIFGIAEGSKTLENREFLTVFPEVLPFESLKLPTEDPFGYQASRKRLFEDPNLPVGVRPYQPEDDFRRVHWGATARTGALQVKIYQPVTSRVMMVCLNVLTSKHPWLGTNQDLLERLVSLAATIACQGIDENYAVGLISNGCLTHADHPFHIPPGRSPGQLAILLEALASVTPYSTAPFEDYILNALPTTAYGATLVVVTGFVPPALSETLLLLKRYRANTTLISLEETPPPNLPGIRVVHLPFEMVPANE